MYPPVIWACVARVPLSPCPNVTVAMWNNTSFPLPLPFVLPLLHHPIYLCVALSGFLHSTAPVLSGPIRGRIFIDLQPPVPGALLLRGLPRSLLPLPSFAASGRPPTPGATDAQCAAQSICHQLSAFSGAMKCGKMGQQRWGGGAGGQEGLGLWSCGEVEGGWESLQWENSIAKSLQ